MGEMAEDMIDGTTCQLCGQFFEDPDQTHVDEKGMRYLYTHGHPVVCWDCWGDLSEGKRRQYVRATVKTI